MNHKTFASAGAVAAILFAGVLNAQSPATLTIHAGQPVAKVSPTLYGLMTEEINYSYDGGLYAEMIRNRTFRDDWSGVHDWFLVEDGNAQAKISPDHETGPTQALTHSLRIDVAKADEHNRAGVLNDGYWGMPLRPNTTYTGAFCAKADPDNVDPIYIGLVSNQTGKVVAGTMVTGLTKAWMQYGFSLTTGAIEPSAAYHLTITIAHPGTLWLGFVSMFPPTYHNRANGNRIDLMEKLAAMHPAFLRLPGGNYLEGNHIPDRFDWKKTVGNIIDRPTHPSPWGYQSTDGLGLLEFLEWCEDLKMQPVLALYAGYSLAQEHVDPGPALEPYVQDALDEIEFVSGGKETKWGFQRERFGHPQPFKLNYVEIGNEDQFDRSGSYDGRFAQFYKAIKAKYPDLQIIATAPVKSVRPDVIDDHFYVRASRFFEDATHYDKTDRTGPKIFVGEWATREGSPTPNFGAALGDAAWMTGMERNSDIVIMSAYAPLLVNVNPGGMQWESDLIGYDAMHSYGSPSYYAQVMFAGNVGDETVASKLDGARPKFFYSVTRDSAKKRLYLKLVNASTNPQAVNIELPGAKLAATAKAITLSAHTTQATNTLAKPTEIVPVESTLKGVTAHLHHTLPGLTIQVLQFDEQ